MPEQTKYAIRCENAKQKEECEEKGFHTVPSGRSVMMRFGPHGYDKVISYSEALSLGLLGEKIRGKEFNIGIVDDIKDHICEYVETFGASGSICCKCGKKFTGLTQQQTFKSNSVKIPPIWDDDKKKYIFKDQPQNIELVKKSGNYCSGPNAGKLLTKTKNCIFVGDNTGSDILEGENIVIIGDNIRNLDKETNKDVLFLGDKVAIGTKLFGKDINIKHIVDEYLSSK